ncbi:histidine kinase, partial [Streptomyces albidoflavus]
MPLPRPRSLAGQLFAMQAFLVGLLILGCVLFAFLSDRRQAEEAAGRQAGATARAAAGAPPLRDASHPRDDP